MKPGQRQRRALLGLAVVGSIVVGSLLARRALQIHRHPAQALGGCVLTYEIDVDHPFDHDATRDEILRSTTDVVRQRAERVATLARVDREGTRVQVEVPGLTGPTIDQVDAQLSRSGRLQLEVVDDGASFMREAAARVSKVPNVGAGHDRWPERPGDGAPTHDDVYLLSSDAQRLAAVVADLDVPPDHEIALGKVADGALRTYYLLRRPALSGERITDAEASWDPQNDRGELTVVFDAEGTRRLEAITSAAIGRKLAFSIEERLVSAPVIKTTISGGRARITLDAGTSLPDAEQLIAALRLGGLAAPIKRIDRRVLR